MDDAEPRPSRERKAPERWQCDANIAKPRCLRLEIRFFELKR
jgi:hypothetical protein